MAGVKDHVYSVQVPAFLVDDLDSTRGGHDVTARELLDDRENDTVPVDEGAHTDRSGRRRRVRRFRRVGRLRDETHH